MVTIPQEMMKEMELEVGQNMLLISEESAIRLEPSVPLPSPGAVEFAAWFTKEHEETMRNFAQR